MTPGGFWKRIERGKLSGHVVAFLRVIKLPGFQGASVYEILKFFLAGLLEGFITTRAAAISFNFFLAIFPFTIFLITIIPYIPIPHFQENLLEIIKSLLPRNTFASVESTIVDILEIKRGGLLSFGFILALFFANNGVMSIITGFNQTIHQLQLRTYFSQLRLSFVLTIVLSSLLIVTILLISAGEWLTQFLLENEYLTGITSASIGVGRWIVLLFLFFITISILYYFAPSDRRDFKFFSPGAIMSTGLFAVTYVIFQFYAVHFSTYNKLYGSIGTLLLILLWIYINSIILILGFELNAAIANAVEKNRNGKDLELKHETPNN